MTETASLVIKVDSSGADRATRSLDKLDRAAGGSERAANKLGKAWGVAIGLISSAAIVGATTAFIRQADAFANMSAKLNLVSKSGADAVKVQRALFDLAQRTSSDLEGVTDLYVKLAQSSDELAGNSELLLSVTERVSKALVISGTDAAGAASVIRQFSQAMGAGALRGDEFISIMENAPRVARAIADGLKVPIGALRDMAAQGKLTADVVIDALESQGAKIDEEFGRMPVTVARATQQVKNSLLQMIGETDKASGASADLAKSIEDLADVLGSSETKAAFAVVVEGLAGIITAATTATGKIAGLLSGYRKWLAEQGFAPTDEFSTPEDMSARRERLQGVIDNNKVFGSETIGKLRAEVAAIDRRMGVEQPAQSYINLPDYLGGTAKPFSAIGVAPFSAIGDMPEGKGASTSSGATGGGTASATKAVTEATRELTRAEMESLAMRQSLNAVSAETLQITADNESAALRAQDAVKGQIADMQFELSLIGKSNEEKSKAIALRYAGAAATDEQRRAIGDLAVKMEEAIEAEQAMHEVKRATSDLFADVISGSMSAGDAFASFAERMKRVAAQVLADKAVQALTNYFGGMFGGGQQPAAQSSGSAFAYNGSAGYMWGGGRAGGGPVMAGQSYRVLDGNEAEIFTPSQNGRITPMSQMGSAKSTPVTVQVINNGGGQARTERSRDGNGGDIIKVIIDQAVSKVNENILKPGGSTRQAMQQTFGLNPRGVPVSG